MILLGTSGYAFPDWEGVYYPAGTEPQDFLPIYARDFDTTELASSDTSLDLGQLADQTPEKFLFSVHLPQSLTHQEELSELVGFVDALRPLVERDKLACVLAAMPPGFANRPENKDFLRQVRAKLGDLPMVVEFSSKDWIVEGTEGWLRENGLCYCCVDQPRLPELVQPVLWATGPVGCVRFHGRNYQDWDSNDPQLEHDYSYDLMELAEWLPKIEDLAAATQLTLIYMANTPRAQAVEAARAMRRMLQFD